MAFVRLCYFLLFFGISTSFAQTANPFFRLPGLNFGYDELYPLFTDSTVHNYYNKVHKQHIHNLNRSLYGTPFLGKTLPELLLLYNKLPSEIRKNAVAHYNYMLFWEILSPKPPLYIPPILVDAVVTQYGDFKVLQNKITTIIDTMATDGWLWLYVTPDLELLLCATNLEHNPITAPIAKNGIPIFSINLTTDLYLNLHGNKTNYLTVLWYLVDWQMVASRYEAAITDPLLRDIARQHWLAYQDWVGIFSQISSTNQMDADWLKLKGLSALLVSKNKALLGPGAPSLFETQSMINYRKGLAAQAKKLKKALKSKPNMATKEDAIKAINNLLLQLK